MFLLLQVTEHGHHGGIKDGREGDRAPRGGGGGRALTQHEKHFLQLPLPGREVQLLRVEAQLLGSVGKAQDTVTASPAHHQVCTAYVRLPIPPDSSRPRPQIPQAQGASQQK